MDADSDDETVRLIGAAMKKSDVAWLSADPADSHAPMTAAWYVWHDGAAYLLTGPGEQQLPGIVGSRACTVIGRSRTTGGRAVTWEAAVATVEPGSPQWQAVVPVLLTKRLNLTDVETATQRWAEHCTVVRLAPTGRLLDDAPPGPPPI